MTYEPADAAASRQRLLTSPGERQDIDYKSSMPFGDDGEFSLKLIRHIQGMANAGGGWLVIGFTERDEQGWVPDPDHSTDICGSYDPTLLSQKVNSYVERGQQVRLSVYLETHPDTGLLYPEIRVEGFERIPFVCRSNKPDNGERILRQGAVFLRRPGAETSEVSKPQDWEDLINRCVRLRRDEYLTEFGALLERMTSPTTGSESAVEQLNEWTAQMRLQAFGA